MQKRLDTCLSTTRKIKDIEEDILEMRARAMSPKNQVITGMPRGGTAENQSDSYMVKLERLSAKKRKLEFERDSQWDRIVEALLNKNVKMEHIELLRYRFYSGMQWRKCCALMCRDYEKSGWNMNKVFRIYRQILRKFTLD